MLSCVSVIASGVLAGGVESSSTESGIGPSQNDVLRHSSPTLVRRGAGSEGRSPLIVSNRIEASVRRHAVEPGTQWRAFFQAVAIPPGAKQRLLHRVLGVRQGRGHHHFAYALYPHAGDWNHALTVRHGYEYNYPLQAMQVAAHVGTFPLEHSFASVQPENVVLTAMKKAEDSDSLIFHAYEWAGKSRNVAFTVPEGATGAILTNLLEQPQGSPLTITSNQLTVPIQPFEILTIRVDYQRAVPSTP